MWKNFVNDYFTYTKKERTGIFVLLGLIALCIFIPFFYPFFMVKKPSDASKFKTEIAKLEIIENDSFSIKKYASKNFDADNFADYTASSEKNYYPKTPSEVFKFDPNNTTTADWKRLGARDKTIETIQKYLSKGGHFYKPEDISKIWGLPPAAVKRLMPYVTIAPKNKEYIKREFPGSPFELKQTAYVPKVFKTVDINAADTTAFIELPGIGSKLAQRIVNFRNKLGGFTSVNQVAETFGLPDSVFQKIRSKLILSGQTVKQININKATVDELKMHPYIRYSIGNAIIQYRNQHGNYSSVADVKKIMVVTEELFSKMENYIKVED